MLSGIGLSTAHCSGVESDPLPSCPAGRLDCDTDTSTGEGGCEVAPDTDANNCGGCGRTCPAAGPNAQVSCVGGACLSTCAGGFADCNADSRDGCETDLASTLSACGTCGTACINAHGQTACVSGACVPACSPGFADCDADASNGCEASIESAANCGACGRSCPSGASCEGGTCSCPAGKVACGSTCTGTASDVQNCGACGKACPAGASCQSGACKCPAGKASCPQTNSCTDTAADAQNCGGCGKACAAGEVCSAGKCDVLCSGGATLCGNACTNVKTDTANCGACGTTCATGEICANGICAPACSGGATQCGKSCVDTKSDPANCGACGMACAAGQTCANGVCGACSCTPVSLASNEARPLGCATDGAKLYWTNNPAGGAGDVRALTLPAGSPQVLFGPSSPSPNWLAVGGGNLYWVTNPGGVVQTMPAGGGAESTFVSSGPVNSVFGHGDTLFFNRADTIWAKPLAGGAETQLYSLGGVVASVAYVDDDYVYWSSPPAKQIGRVLRANGTNQILASSQQDPLGMASDGKAIIWVTQADGAVWALPVSGSGQPQTIASGQCRPVGAARDSSRLYWVNNCWGGNGSVMALPLCCVHQALGLP